MEKRGLESAIAIFGQLESGIMPNFFGLMEAISEVSIVLTEGKRSPGHRPGTKKSTTCDPQGGRFTC